MTQPQPVTPSPGDFEAMALATSTGILVHEAETKNILWANPAACQMFGFTLEELRPLKAHHMSSPEKRYRRQIGVAWLQDAVDKGVSRTRWKYRAKDGRMFLTDAVARLVTFESGPVVMVQFRPIPDAEQRHDELLKAADYLPRLMAHTSAGVLLLDESMNILDADPLVAGLIGVPLDVLIGSHLSEVLHPEDHSDLLTPHEVVAGHSREILFSRDVSGQQRWLSGALEDVAHDGICSRLLVLRDVTERVEMQRTANFQESKLQYLSRYHAMGDMAMIIAHELGQPLAAATNFLFGIDAYLRSRDDVPTHLGYGMKQAQRQLSRAMSIVSSVRRYVARIEPTAAQHDLRAIVEDVQYFLDLRADELGVHLTTDIGDDPLPIHGDSILIGQVVTNIVFNALTEAARPETSRPEVRLALRRTPTNQAIIEVQDWGRGMPLDQGMRLAQTAFSDKSDGSGIGLLLSERITERHNGRITYSNGDGAEGTIVTVRLPLAPDRAASQG